VKNPNIEIRAVLKASAANPKWFDWPFDRLTAMSPSALSSGPKGSVKWLTILSEVEGQYRNPNIQNSKQKRHD